MSSLIHQLVLEARNARRDHRGGPAILSAESGWFFVIEVQHDDGVRAHELHCLVAWHRSASGTLTPLASLESGCLYDPLADDSGAVRLVAIVPPGSYEALEGRGLVASVEVVRD